MFLKNPVVSYLKNSNTIKLTLHTSCTLYPPALTCIKNGTVKMEQQTVWVEKAEWPVAPTYVQRFLHCCYLK